MQRDITSSLQAILTVLLTSAGVVAASSPAAEKVYDVPPPFSTVEHEAWAQLVHLWLKHGATLLSLQLPRVCPACGSSFGRPIFASHDGYPFTECSDCGCWYVPHRIEPALYAQFFEICPEARRLAKLGFAKRSSAANLAGDLARIGAYLDLLQPHVPTEARGADYLDVGAGTGSSLLAARDRGLEAIGVEVVPEALEIAAQRGVRMVDGALGLPEGPFGLVSLWETLEHLDDPCGSLRAIASVLAPRGLVAITVPNLNSLMTRVMRGDCSFVGGGSDGPGHINLFGAGQLERLFARAGLSLVYVDGQYSTNFLELAGYLLGRHRGAVDLLGGAPISCRLPAALGETLNSLGPALALMERRAMLTPVVMAVACRKDDRPEMQGVAEALNAMRDGDIAQEAKRLRGNVTDYLTAIESWQREVTTRDNMLTTLQATAIGMQAELQILRANHPLAALVLKAVRRMRRFD